MTASFIDGEVDVNKFADSSYQLTELSGSADGNTFSGTILMDTDRLEWEYDWDDENWGMTVKKASVSLTAYRSGDNFGQAVTKSDQQSGDPSRYIVLVNDNYDQQRSDGGEDDSRTTAPIQGGQMQTGSDGKPLDPDFGELKLSVPSGLNTGTVTLSASDSSAISFFDDNGAAISDPTFNLDSSSGG